MAGEYAVARQLIADAIGSAETESTMDSQAMAIALLRELLGQLASSHSRKDLDNLIQYQLDSQDSDEFLVTRGC